MAIHTFSHTSSRVEITKKQFEHQFVSDGEKVEEGHRQTKKKSLIRCQSSHRIDRYLTGSAIFGRKEEWGLLNPLYNASQTLLCPSQTIKACRSRQNKL